MRRRAALSARRISTQLWRAGTSRTPPPAASRRAAPGIRWLIIAGSQAAAGLRPARGERVDDDHVERDDHHRPDRIRGEEERLEQDADRGHDERDDARPAVAA